MPRQISLDTTRTQPEPQALLQNWKTTIALGVVGGVLIAILGASAAELETQRQDLARYSAMYANPFLNAAITFLEPLPVGVVVTLIAAAALRTRGV